MFRVNLPTLRHRARPTLRRRDQGFTLVELMVGLAIGLIVVTALLVLFANASSSGQNLARSSIQIENGRYVSELLREDLRLAGFFGEVPDSPAPANYTNPDPCLVDAASTGFVNSPFGLPAPIQGFKTTDVVACLSDRKAGTSAVAIRRLSVDTTATASAVANQDYVQYSFCATDPAATQMIAGRGAGTFTLQNFACTATNPVRAYVSRIYYIATCNRCGAGGDNVPTLKRVDRIAGALVTTPLVEGVEELRFEYGFDTDTDGTADTYLVDDNAPALAGAASLWQNAMTVRAHFIVRSLDKVTGGPTTAAAEPFVLGRAASAADPGDGFARRVYSTTIRLVNPSGSRETSP